MDEAADGYERCLRHDPNLADAHWALAKQSPGRDTQARVARIGQSMRHHPADSIERTATGKARRVLDQRPRG